MKNLQRFGFLLLAIMGVHRSLYPLPDWAVRTDGAGMLVGLFLVSFSTAKRIQKR